MRTEELLPDASDHLALGDGILLRKGSVGAFLKSWRQWREGGADSAAARRDVEALLPGLIALGLFDVLHARDPELSSWIEVARSRGQPDLGRSDPAESDHS